MVLSPDRIIIIGAGAAGLYAARLLHESGAAVTVLEAADQPGGRVKSIANFAAFPLELGAEEIQGEKSLSYRLSRAQGLQLRACRDRVYLWQDLCAGRRSSLARKDPDSLHAQRFLNALPDYGGPDVLLARPLSRCGAARPSVAFAGEATHDRLFGSLQGALLSAERAVRELRAVQS